MLLYEPGRNVGDLLAGEWIDREGGVGVVGVVEVPPSLSASKNKQRHRAPEL